MGRRDTRGLKLGEERWAVRKPLELSMGEVAAAVRVEERLCSARRGKRGDSKTSPRCLF